RRIAATALARHRTGRGPAARGTVVGAPDLGLLVHRHSEFSGHGRHIQSTHQEPEPRLMHLRTVRSAGRGNPMTEQETFQKQFGALAVTTRAALVFRYRENLPLSHVAQLV